MPSKMIGRLSSADDPGREVHSKVLRISTVLF